MVEIWAIPIWNGHCAGTYCSVQPENSVTRVQGSLNLTFAHTGKFGQILCYTCGVVRMVHEHHDAPCFDQGVEWSRYGQYQFGMVIVRARIVQFNLKIASFTFKEVVRMVHEHHDAPCFDQGVEWSRYGQYQFGMVIVRARTVQFNLKIASFTCKGA